ncbi:hypothetical protein AAFF_G00033580 [Aldrovandia affinis]|uniref:Uncharacterized protein n=1 Tax=Aldrovandia affinis TaxID=143900 RepID=A0AAD7S3Z7_9TELE|nr:hypothetical protein AAFF_G00033580 [Aldrovandia affinis]
MFRLEEEGKSQLNREGPEGMPAARRIRELLEEQHFPQEAGQHGGDRTEQRSLPLNIPQQADGMSSLMNQLKEAKLKIPLKA